MKREPTRIYSIARSPRLLKLAFPYLVFSDHNSVLADCDLKATINKKPPRKVYPWSKTEWQQVKEQTEIFATQFLAVASARNTWKGKKHQTNYEFST